jgi:hypothetical protein
VNDSRNPHVRIFLSYIFLSAKPEQENVGEENKSGRFLKSFTMAETKIKAVEHKDSKKE